MTGVIFSVIKVALQQFREPFLEGIRQKENWWPKRGPYQCKPHVRIVCRNNFNNFFQMAISFLAYAVTFLGKLHFTRNYFFTVIISAEQLLPQSNWFEATVSFSELLIDQSKATYLEQLFFLHSSYSSKIVSLFRGTLLLTSYFLRIGSSLGQLVFQNSYYLGRQICSEYRYIQKSFFFEAGTFTKHQIFLDSYFPRSATFNVMYTFSGELLF